MDWIITTGSTEEEALDAALDQLSVTHDDVEYEVVKEPRRALLGFGTRRAQIRTRVRPIAVPAKRDRRRPARSDKQKKTKNKSSTPGQKSRSQKQQRASKRRPPESQDHKRSPKPPNHQDKLEEIGNGGGEAPGSTKRKRTLKADGTPDTRSNIRSTTRNESPPSEHPTPARRVRKINH